MNHIRKRIMVIIAAVFICCTFIKGQIVYADEPSGKIEVLMTLSEYEMRPYLDDFEKKYPYVIVKCSFYQIYEEEVKKRMETGDYGDVLLFPSFVEAMKLIKLHTDAIPFYTNYNADFTLQQWEVFPFIDMTGDAGYLSGGYLNDRNPYRKGTTHYKEYRL